MSESRKAAFWRRICARQTDEITELRAQLDKAVRVLHNVCDRLQAIQESPESMGVSDIENLCAADGEARDLLDRLVLRLAGEK